jgi:hypothetical protein
LVGQDYEMENGRGCMRIRVWRKVGAFIKKRFVGASKYYALLVAWPSASTSMCAAVAPVASVAPHAATDEF